MHSSRWWGSLGNLDAPDMANDQPNGGKAGDVVRTVTSGIEPALTHSSQLRNMKPNTTRLGAEESTAIAEQLILEIEGLSNDNVQSRAIALLKAKNRLSAGDAKRVEDAFAARIGRRPAALPDESEDVSASVPVAETSSEPVPTLTARLARGRGRPRKTQKSELTISEPRRHRDKTHLKFVASQPCLVCGRIPADAHHLRFTQPRALGRKVSDEFTVPLCRTHHGDNHRFGDEQAWWNSKAIDPVETSRRLWVSTRRIE